MLVDNLDRITVLQEQHTALDEKIKHAEKNYEGNLRVNFLKKSKLKIKDEITALQKKEAL